MNVYIFYIYESDYFWLCSNIIWNDWLDSVNIKYIYILNKQRVKSACFQKVFMSFFSCSLVTVHTLCFPKETFWTQTVPGSCYKLFKWILGNSTSNTKVSINKIFYFNLKINFLKTNHFFGKAIYRFSDQVLFYIKFIRIREQSFPNFSFNFSVSTWKRRILTANHRIAFRINR